MYTKSREEEVKLLKKLWLEEPVLCPKCHEAELTHLHKKAKKSNTRWKCPACGEIYKTMSMLSDLPDDSFR